MAQENHPTEPPSDRWNDQLAANLLGRIVLVGVTHLTKDEQVLRQEQFYGVVAAVDRRAGISLELQGLRTGDTHILPPDTSNLQRARPGTYNLRSTGESVEDPDYLTSWTVYPRDDA